MLVAQPPPRSEEGAQCGGGAQNPGLRSAFLKGVAHSPILQSCLGHQELLALLAPALSPSGPPLGDQGHSAQEPTT